MPLRNRARWRRNVDRIAKIDWRIWAVILTVIVSIALTVTVYRMDFNIDPETHFGAVFASWVGGVALFTIAGSIISVISLVKPEQDPFDSRARILFRRQSGYHIDYILTRLPDILEHYADSTDRKIIIDDFDETNSMFRVSIETGTLVKSYIDDITTNYNSDFKMSATEPLSGQKRNRLVYLRLNARPEGTGEEFGDTVERPFQTTIGAGGACLVENRFEVWVRSGDELNRHRPARYTRSIRVEIENRLSTRAVLIRTQDAVEFRVPAGTTHLFVETKDVKPKEPVYAFYMFPA